jgi:hypothetical protein
LAQTIRVSCTNCRALRHPSNDRDGHTEREGVILRG